MNLKIDRYIYRQADVDWHLTAFQPIHFFDLTYVVKGKVNYIVNGAPHLLRAGDVFYAPKGVYREGYTFEEDLVTCYAFNFQIDQPPDLPAVTHLGMDRELLDLLGRLDTARVARSAHYETLCAGTFLLLMAKTQAAAASGQIRDKRVSWAVDYLMHNYSEKITVNDLAQTLKINPVYFGALFRKHTGETVKQFQNGIRVNRAKDLLADGNSVTHTAYACGFENIYYFSNVFKQLTGCSPSQYRLNKAPSIL